MKMAQGKTLYENVAEHGYSAFKHSMLKAAELTGICHAVTPLSASVKGELNLVAKARDRLERLKPHLLQGGMSMEQYTELASMMVPWLGELFSTNTLLAVNYDSHPSQFIDGKMLVRVDTEDKGTEPAAMDFANIYLYFDSLIPEYEIQELVASYISGRDQFSESPSLNPESFMQESLTLGTERILSLASAWSSENRKSLWEHRPKILTNGVEAIELIRKRFHSSFLEHHAAYDGLQQGFDTMAGYLIKVHS